MYPDYDEAVDPPGSFPPLVSRLHCGLWSNLGRLVRLDFSASDDLTLIDMAWRALRALQMLLLNDIRCARGVSRVSRVVEAKASRSVTSMRGWMSRLRPCSMQNVPACWG